MTTPVDPRSLTTERAVAALDSLPTGDADSAHATADEYLLQWMRDHDGAAVVEAYERVKDRAAWWACA